MRIGTCDDSDDAYNKNVSKNNLDVPVPRDVGTVFRAQLWIGNCNPCFMQKVWGDRNQRFEIRMLFSASDSGIDAFRFTTFASLVTKSEVTLPL